MHLSIRVLEAFIGIFFLATALLLYPNEDGKIQSSLEDFWVHLDDYQNKPLSRHTKFMIWVATLENAILNRLFGNKLFSEQAATVSICLSFAAFAYAYATFWGFEELVSHALIDTAGPTPLYFAAQQTSVWSSILIVVTLTALFFRLDVIRRRLLLILSTAASLCLVVWLTKRGHPLPDKERVALGASMALVLLLGFLCSVSFIALARWTLKFSEQLKSSFKLLCLVILNLGVALVLVSPAFLPGVASVPRDEIFTAETWSTFLIAFPLSNAIDVALASLFVLLASLLLLHRLLWPLLTRTLFRMGDIGTKGRRGILTAVGIALLSTSVFGEKFPDLLKEVLKGLGG